jgi:trehalose 6-phosphate phosphatase
MAQPGRRVSRLEGETWRAIRTGQDRRVSPELQAMVDQVRADLDRALIALDFDGTLAPIVPDPTQSRPVSGALDALRRLAEQGAAIAIVTGRDARTVVELGGLDQVPGLRVAGLYGAEEWRDGRLDSPPEPPPLRTARARLPRVLADADADPAIWVEDKRLSLVVHARKAADPDAALAPVRAPVTALAAELGLEAHPGRDVLELRLPGYDKGRALRRVVEETGRGTVLFVGDDLGDLPAFETVRRLRAEGHPAWGVAVASDEALEVSAAADLLVAGPAQVADLLAAIGR